MKKGWKTKKLGEVLKIQNGYAFNSKLFIIDKGTPLIRIRDIKEGIGTVTNFNGSYEKKYEVKAGDFLIGMDGEFGCYEWKGDVALLNQRVCRLQEFSNNLDSRFLFYGINKYLKAIEDVTAFVTVKHISSKQIEAIEIPLPPLPEQQRIVIILDEVFAVIAKAKANAEQNLKNAKELFESYLQEVFENKGEGWEEKALGETCIVERGSSPRPIKKYITDDKNGVNWIKIGDTKNIDKYLYKTKEKITKKGAEKSRYVKEGDFILSNSMSFGKPYIMKTEGYIHDGWFVLRLPQNINTEFFWYLLASPYTMNQFTALSTGAIVKNISGDLVKKTILPIPALAEQQAIVHKLDTLSAEAKKLEAIYQQKITDLEELKKSVLQKAFNGELKTTKAAAA